MDTGSSLTQLVTGTTPPLKILALLTVLSLLPAIVMTTTSFVRTVVVLSFLRQGIGTQQTPPTQVLMGLAIFMTVFTMSPIAARIQSEALAPYQAGTLDEAAAFDAAASPLRSFMLRQTRQADLELFYEATHAPQPQAPEDVPMRIAIPAFVVSELTTAFQMGVVLLLPFLVIDLAVASILMAMGMVFVSPTTISLPLKLLLFVLADGWNLIVRSLLESFR
jgi:flagellar biosynthetic protein FliP